VLKDEVTYTPVVVKRGTSTKAIDTLFYFVLKDEVTYTPVVVKRGTSTKAIDTLFYFVLKDAAGVYLNSDISTPKASQTVTRAHCVQAGGDVSVTITSAN
jgi:hypothetical protein